VSPPLPELPRYRVLGVDVQAIDIPTLFDLVDATVRADDRCIIGNHNLHSVYLYHHDDRMRQFYQRARFVFVDGTPIVYLARVLGMPFGYRHRISSIHWIRPLLALGVERGWRTLLLGGRPETVEGAAQTLRRDVPGAQLATTHGYFDATPGSVESEGVLERIARFRPHLVCVGMGMPRQEHWIADNFDRLEANVVFNLGGFMELLTGELPMPPQWVSRLNLEWAFRLVTRPRRVWRRYLMEPWSLMPYLMRDLTSRVRQIRPSLTRPRDL
jgi:N-acetylglucosaminyldiphosphoundecaprenol N-acetyl-beta-D-mannosaminyltransferase